MKFSNDEKKLADFIFAFRDMKTKKATTSDEIEAQLKPFKDILVDNIKDLKNMEKMVELLKYIDRTEFIPYLETWPIPIFPITCDHLTEKNVPKGPVYSKILSSLKTMWKDELNFKVDKPSVDLLLNKCDELLK